MLPTLLFWKSPSAWLNLGQTALTFLAVFSPLIFRAPEQTQSFPQTAFDLRAVVEIKDTWLSIDGLKQSTLVPLGNHLVLKAEIFNALESSQSIWTIWNITGPCGIMIDDKLVVITPPGFVTWNYIGVLALEACPGDYLLTVGLVHEGAYNESVTAFVVVAPSVYLPSLTR